MSTPPAAKHMPRAPAALCAARTPKGPVCGDLS